MSKKNLINYRKIFITLLWEYLNNDCNAYYRGIGNNNMFFLLKDFLYYLNLEKSLIRNSQINILLEEFLYLSENDVIFNSNFKINSKEIILEIKNEKKELDILKLRNNLEIIFKNLNDNDSYQKALLGLLKSYLDNNKYNTDYENNYQKNLKRLKKIIFNFLDFLKYEKGISRKYLEFLRETYLNNINCNNNQVFLNGLYNFTKLFTNSNKEFNIYFKINIGEIQANKRKLERNDISYIINRIGSKDIYYIDNISENIDGKEFDSKFLNQRKKFEKSDENIFYIGIKTYGKDIHSVYKNAKNLLNRLFDTFLFEFNALKLNINRISLISDLNRIYVIDSGYVEYANRKKGNEKNIISLNNILNNDKYNLDTKNKIINSLKYYKLFLDSENGEVKLLNLWIALESLFSSIDNSDSAFDKLKSFIPKLISMNLMKNYFDEFQEYILHKIDMEIENKSRYKNHHKIKEIISDNNKVKNGIGIKEGKFNNVGILKSLSNKEIFLEIEKLLHNEYFIQKYKRLVNLVEKDDNGEYKNLLTFLKRYENKMKWLLTKIYRYRNYIVHGGKKINTEKVINDLEFFYLELIEDILDKIGDKKININSLNEYFLRINRSYKVYEKGINNRIKDHKIADKHVVLPFIVY